MRDRCGVRDGGAAQLTKSASAEYLAGPWKKDLPIVMIPASDGVQVPGHLIRPQDLGAKPNGAAVIFVHGAGYLHNVDHYWSEYPREQMFNHFLASKGYTVLDIDYPASAGYVRDWRTAIYRWMGGRDLADQVDGSKWLTRTYGIHPERIGMYGGSYGGFMTLMGLFTAPKYFGAGAALRSVTDWSHYNHGYTSQILNQPQDDSLAYHRSSPIFFAEGLEDPLVMFHGMVDTNVEFQDIVRLTQRLIELGKTGWWLAPYPVENHGFTRPDSWTDEYSRIFSLFETTIGPKGSKARQSLLSTLNPQSAPPMIQTAHGTPHAEDAPQSLVARVSALVRRIIGVPDYATYKSHMATCHPDQPLLTEQEFAEDRLVAKYSKPGQRCC